MLIKYTILFIITLMIMSPSLSQKCLSLNEFKRTKGNIMEIKSYLKDVVTIINSKEIPNFLGQRIKYLAEGSFGKVYLYKSPKGKNLAVKMIQKTPNKRTHVLEFDLPALFKEIHANSCLVDLINLNPEQSPRFVILTGVFYLSDTDEYVLSMNYYSNTLNKYLTTYLNKPYDTASSSQKNTADHLIYTLAQTLEFMHSNNLSHRDLKPENIMMNDVNPLFVDFGLTTPEANMFSTIAGTPFFIDPKLINTSMGGKETDVYAMGIIFYIILKGSSAYTSLENMMIKGNWGEKGLKYSPNTQLLQFPKKYASLASMLSQSSRPTISQVVETIEQIQGKQKLPPIEEKHIYGGRDMYKIQEKAPESVNQRVEKYEERIKQVQMDKQANKIKYNYPQHIAQYDKPQYIQYEKQEVAPVKKYPGQLLEGYRAKYNHLNQVKYEYPQHVYNKPANVYQNAKREVNESEFKYELNKNNMKFVPKKKEELTEQQKEFIRVRQEAQRNRNNLNRINNIFLI